MNLKEARLREGLQQTDVIPILKQVEPKIDVSLLSKMENGICQPTPPVLEMLCKIYKTTAAELIGKRPDTHKAKTHKIFGRVDIEVVGDLDTFKFALAECGYKSQGEWLTKCVKKLYQKAKAT